MSGNQNMNALLQQKHLSDFVVIGEVGCGKTALMNALLQNGDALQKTQAAVFHRHNVIDTPGEFVGRRAYYGALLATIADVSTLLYLQAANNPFFSMPAGLLTVYPKKRIVGVITKVDLPDADLSTARRLLHENGIHEPFFTSSTVDNKGIAKLRSYLLALPSGSAGPAQSQPQLNVA